MIKKKTCRNPGARKTVLNPSASRNKAIGPEAKMQIDLLKWIRLQHPEISKHVIYVPNDGKRSVIGHNIAKKMGLHVGCSDLFIAYPSCGAHGLFLELKRDGWKLTPSQKEHHDRQMDFIGRMSSVGYAAVMAIGIDAAMTVINSYLLKGS